MPNFLDRLLGGGSSDSAPPVETKDVGFWDRTGIRDAEHERVQGIVENNRRNLAYNALRKTYGDIAGDPQSAASLQSTQQASELFPIKKQASQLALDDGLATRQRQAGLTGALYVKKVWDRTQDPAQAGAAFDHVYKIAPALFGSPEEAAQAREQILADPSNLDGLIESLRDPSKTAATLPSSIQENMYAEQLRASDPQAYERYIRIKRADPAFKLTDVGGVPTVVRGNAATGAVSTTPLSTLPAEVDAAGQIKSAEAQGAAVGKGQGEQIVKDLPLSKTELVKAQSRINEMDAQFEFVNNALDEALARVGPLSAGLGSATTFIPGSPAANLKEELAASESEVLLNTLTEMKAMSKTGSAGFGQLSNAEGDTLRAKWGSIKTSQSPAALRDAIEDFRGQLQRSVERVKQAYVEDLAARGQSPRGPQTQPADADSLLRKYGVE